MKRFKNWFCNLEGFEKGIFLFCVVTVGGLLVLITICARAESYTCSRFFPDVPKMVCMFTDNYKVEAK